ncbi:MAG: sigma-54-dependent Fis family transcriptional regulator [Deltaproteobacteria bacterium]|nr:sigma-54-dependent Fis family transcriptional regulator [Deltaproteobacteria bacterium]
MRPKILVVDDEYAVRDSLYKWLSMDGYQVELAADGQEALEWLQRSAFDVALVDLKMPGIDGVELQRRIHEHCPQVAVIIITAFASVETAVEVLKHGAFDYLSKPVDPDDLSRLVRRAIEVGRLSAENLRLRQAIDTAAPALIVGESPAMQRVRQRADEAASNEHAVTLLGEAGSGKRSVAAAIHNKSPRRYFSLVPIHCGALVGDHAESELIGHEIGALAGSQFLRRGKFELADGGTLLLDDVGALSPRLQALLVQTIEGGSFTRLGGKNSISSNFRLICTSEAALDGLHRRGRLIDDLYYRINVLTIDVPPLRERRQDIPLLVEHLIRRLRVELGRPNLELTPGAIELLTARDWPGNVRELFNVVERTAVVTSGPIEANALIDLSPAPGAPADQPLAAVERAHLLRVIEHCQGDLSQAASVLQIDRALLDQKLQEHGLSASGDVEVDE